MPSTSRNALVDVPWILQKVEDRALCNGFDCGDHDLNEYFQKDSINYQQELLTQSYCLQRSDLPNTALVLLDFCNDNVHIDQYKNVIDIDDSKRKRHLPAVKLTRIGVQKRWQGMNIGTHALNMAKRMFLIDNRTGCRFLTVDAYNQTRVIEFYKQNDFDVFPVKIKPDAKTVPMYFDLKRLIALQPFQQPH
jgi:hypothetical protein